MDQKLLALAIVSNGVTALAYVVAIQYGIRMWKDRTLEQRVDDMRHVLTVNHVTQLFGQFILWCGLHHGLMTARLMGARVPEPVTVAVDSTMAVVSALTAVVLLSLLRKRE